MKRKRAGVRRALRRELSIRRVLLLVGRTPAGQKTGADKPERHQQLARDCQERTESAAGVVRPQPGQDSQRALSGAWSMVRDRQTSVMTEPTAGPVRSTPGQDSTAQPELGQGLSNHGQDSWRSRSELGQAWTRSGPGQSSSSNCRTGSLPGAGP